SVRVTKLSFPRANPQSVRPTPQVASRPKSREESRPYILFAIRPLIQCAPCLSRSTLRPDEKKKPESRYPDRLARYESPAHRPARGHPAPSDAPLQPPAIFRSRQPPES